MTGLRIYVEGGGQSSAGKSQIRRGFGEFMQELREAARGKRLSWTVVAAGSRDSAFNDFLTATDLYPDEFVILLVDSEGLVAGNLLAHLAHRDNWIIPASKADNVHAMVQTQESWIVCDTAALQKYYGAGFRASSLPVHPDIEQVDRRDVARSLDRATERSKKGTYHKINHGGDVLTVISPALVRARSAHCERLFVTLKKMIDAV